MKLSEYQRSTSSFDLGQRSLRFQSLMFDFDLYTQVSDSGPWALLLLIYFDGLGYCVLGRAKTNKINIYFAVS